MRSGAELLQATKPFAVEDRGRSWRLLLATLVISGATFAATVAVPWWPARLALALLQGCLLVRLFIFYHDHLHGAVLVRSPLGSAVMSAFGLLVLAPRSVWRETHNYHHKNNAKLIGSSIGSYPVVTVGMWRGMSPGQRRAYQLVRHPVTIVLGYLTLFALGMCVAPFRRDPKAHWGGPVALALHLLLLAGLTFLGGWQLAVFGLALPLFVACALGAYLFYAQHNFPDIQLKGRRDWDYTFAALRSSSYFEMGPLMHWFTGNIGFHHVHHLNHRIPFYRLREAMAAIPELQSPGRTSWRPADVAACLALDLWDPDQGRMVRFRDAELPQPEPQAAS